MGSATGAKLLVIFFVSSLHSPTSTVSALNANVSSAVVYTNFGEDAEIFCFVPEELVATIPPNVEKLCRYYLTDPETSQRVIRLNATDSSISGQEGPGHFEYLGTGVNNGQCGLKIFSVASEQIGDWTCSFIGGEIWQASIQVLKYEKPESPTMTVDGDKTEINVTDWQNDAIVQNSTTILCCSVGGKPITDTKLALYLDDIEQTDVILKKNHTSSTCIQWEKTFTKEFNDQSLICKVSHPALIGVDVGSEEIQYSLTVNVEYSPEIMYPEGEEGDSRRGDFITKRHYTHDSKKVDLHFTVRGNPIPNVTIKRNSTSELGDVELVEVDVWNVEVHSEKNSNEFVVTIDAPAENGEKLEVEITVENLLGKDLGTTIVSPPEGGDTGSTTLILIIVGVVMSLIFIGIIAFGVNNQAKNRGWFGYEARVEKYRVKNVAKNKQPKNAIPDHEYTSVGRMEESKF